MLALSGQAILAEVTTREKTQGKFEGMLARMANIVGGKAAREGIVTTSAVKGNRKATFNETTGRIVDLGKRRSTSWTSGRRPSGHHGRGGQEQGGDGTAERGGLGGMLARA